MKKLIIAFFLFSAIFAGNAFADSVSVNNEFQMEVSGGYNINTPVAFNNGLSVSGTGGLVCPGSTASISPTATGKWASGGAFSAFSQYARCLSGGVCPPLWQDYSTITPDRDVKWLSASDYATVVNTYPPALDSPDPIVDTFSNQPVSYQQRIGEVVSNKLGGPGIFCKGNYRMFAQDPGGSQVEMLNSPMPSLSPRDVTLTTEGTWTIRSELSGVECFAAVKQLPEPADPRFFAIYMYTANRLTAPLVGAQETIQVTNARASSSFSGISCPSSTCLPPPGPMEIAPGTSKYVIITLTNTGSVPIVFNSVSATNGFTAAPLPPVAMPNGFNSEVLPGSSRQLHITLTAPNPLPPSTSITFTATATEATCSPSQPQQITIPLDFTVTPPSGVPGLNHACTIAPSFASTFPATFALTCTELSTGNTVPCSATQWAINGGLIGDITSSSVNSATVEIRSTSGTGTLSATNGSYSCTATLDASNNRPYQCTVTPAAARVLPNTATQFTLGCTYFGNPVPCRSTLWSLSGLMGTLTGATDNGVVATITSTSGSGTLTATNSSYLCSATIDIDDGNNPYACSMVPSSATVNPNDATDFSISCTRSGMPVPCSATQWNVLGLSGAVSNPTVSSATLTVTSASGSGSFVATNGSYSCSAPVDVACQGAGCGPCPGGNCGGGGGGGGPVSENCQLSPYPYAYLYPGQRQMFELRCADSGGMFNDDCGGNVQFSGVSSPFTIVPNVPTGNRFDYLTIQASSAPSDLGKSGRVCANGNVGGRSALCCSVATISGNQCRQFA